MSAEEEIVPTILKFPTAAENDLERLEELSDAARQMDENEARWAALEAQLPPRPLPRTEAEKKNRRHAARFAEQLLARYRKDGRAESGTGARQ